MLGIEILKRVGSGGAGGGVSGAVDLRAATILTAVDESWTIAADGFTYKTPIGDPPVQDLTWIEPQTGMSSYDVRATLVSGVVPDSGNLNVWESLSGNRTWGYAPDLSTSVLNIEIRLSSTGSIIDSANVKFSKLHDPGF